MVANDMVSNVVPVLKGTDGCLQALNWMEMFRVSHLPLTDEGVYLGLVGEDLLYAHGDPGGCVGELELPLEGTFVYEDSHVYDVVRLVCSGELSVVPVLDRDGGFVGSIVLSDVLHGLDRMLRVEEPGAVVVLDVDRLNYSLSDVVRVVEGNEAHVLSCCLNGAEDSRRVRLTLKVDTAEVGGLLDAFERYGYVVSDCFGTGEVVRDAMRERYGLLMKYLSV